MLHAMPHPCCCHRLHRHPEVTHWVVLDDLDLTWDDDSVTTPSVMLDHFVQTDPDQGMTAEDAARALAILAEPCKGPLPPARKEGEVLTTPPSEPVVMEAVADSMACMNVGG